MKRDELKAFDVGLGQYCKDGSLCVVAFDADRNPRLLNNEKVYLKSEADKAMAELIEKNKRLSNDSRIKASNTFREIEKEVRHHKYKRCLAMAKVCYEKSERMYCEASTAKSLNEILGKEPKDAVVEKFELWGAIASTHRKIWLALAEEPTWTKFLQLIRKEAK